MGVAAHDASGGGEYAIHGTNQPNLIGGFVSHGCIRMYNADVTDLFGRVNVGTPVVVIRQDQGQEILRSASFLIPDPSVTRTTIRACGRCKRARSRP